jgi:hypothetical protein
MIFPSTHPSFRLHLSLLTVSDPLREKRRKRKRKRKR